MSAVRAAIPAQIVALDVWVMLATALLLVKFAIASWRIIRSCAPSSGSPERRVSRAVRAPQAEPAD